ncbi:MAG TPA: RsmE family RNA methyltransferase [Terriglobales bacterium]|nr:RsmE family RNA methyltransferase [Terriglobales bacterium]
MTRRRWIADEVSGDRATLLGEHAEHLARVLRARVGQEFDIAGGGRVRRGRIISISPERVDFELAEDVPASDLPKIHLVLAIFKFDRFEWAIEKATELGVARVTPVIARRTDAHLAASAGKRVERWKRIAREAAEQSRRALPPEVADPVKLASVLSVAGGTRIVLAESETGVTLKQALASTTEPVTLAIGPEGGWTDDESKRFVEHGWVAASLGTTILRAETAAIAALAVALAELMAGD